jgi:hypothetical protein
MSSASPPGESCRHQPPAPASGTSAWREGNHAELLHLERLGWALACDGEAEQDVAARGRWRPDRSARPTARAGCGGQRAGVAVAAAVAPGRVRINARRSRRQRAPDDDRGSRPTAGSDIPAKASGVPMTSGGPRPASTGDCAQRADQVGLRGKRARRRPGRSQQQQCLQNADTWASGS